MISLRQTIDAVKHDLPSEKYSLRLFFVCYFFNPTFRVLLNYRLGRYFSYKKCLVLKVLVRYYRAKLIVKRSCEISYRADIGKNLRLPHPFGIVIGDEVVIRDNVMIFQQVTLGSHGRKGKAFKYPIIESGVKIYAGAKIVGGVRIGHNAIIGANSLVNIDVPPETTAVGIPCRILNR